MKTNLLRFLTFTSIFIFLGFNQAFAKLLPPPATDYYTIANGAFDSNIWSKASHVGPTCTCSPCVCSPCNIPANSIIHIAHIVTITCDISIGSNSTLIIENGGSLTVLGNGSITGTGFFQIDAGGSATVTGNFTVGGTGDATINGSLTVVGDLTLTGGAGSDICGGGTIVVGGTVTGVPDPCFTGALPIELLYFTGDINNSDVHLKWATASETSNDYFTIMRSENGQDWSNLMIVNGAGNSSSLLEYSRIDDNPLGGISYYKLRQTDFDGVFTESNTIAVQNNNSSKPDVLPFPNPTNGNSIGLEILGLNDSDVEITVTDLIGQVQFNNIYPITDNNAKLTLNFNTTLAAGSYIVTATSNQTMICKKIMIK